MQIVAHTQIHLNQTKKTFVELVVLKLNDPIIGQGERITIKILSELMPNALLDRQVPLSRLLKLSYLEDMGERAKKETLDIVVYRPLFKKPLVIRVQDDRHKTKAFSIIDERQKNELENSNCDVVDLWKSDCPEVFKENNYELAKEEIKNLLDDYL